MAEPLFRASPFRLGLGGQIAEALNQAGNLKPLIDSVTDAQKEFMLNRPLASFTGDDAAAMLGARPGESARSYQLRKEALGDSAKYFMTPSLADVFGEENLDEIGGKGGKMGQVRMGAIPDVAKVKEMFKDPPVGYMNPATGEFLPYPAPGFISVDKDASNLYFKSLAGKAKNTKDEFEKMLALAKFNDDKLFKMLRIQLGIVEGYTNAIAAGQTNTAMQMLPQLQTANAILEKANKIGAANIEKMSESEFNSFGSPSGLSVQTVSKKSEKALVARQVTPAAKPSIPTKLPMRSKTDYNPDDDFGKVIGGF